MVEIWIVSGLLLVTLFLLITEILPLDVVSIGIVAALALTRLLTPAEAVSGFANPAVITVAAMFLISRGMIRSGVVEQLSDWVSSLAGGNPQLAIGSVFIIVGLSSAFINNTPVVVLFIPVIMSMCCQYGLSPSKYLIPLSYASILAGTCTLIGTSTNIIVSDLSAGYGYGEIGMFELSKAGIPIALSGILFIWLTAPKLMPKMANPACELENGDHRKYLSHFVIPKSCPLVGKEPREILRKSYASIEVIELVRYDHIFYPDRDTVQIAGDDLLLVKGSARDLVRLMRDNGLEASSGAEISDEVSSNSERMIVEMIIPPQSRVLGGRLRNISALKGPDIHVIAIQRSGLHYTERKIHDIRLKVGDILLVQLTWSKLDLLRAGSDYIIVEDVHHAIAQKEKARYAGLIFVGVVTMAATGYLDIMIAAITGVFLMFATGCLTVRDAYRALQGNVLMLIAGTIAMGIALEKTGAGRLYAEWLLGLLGGFSPVVVLGCIVLLTSISTQLLSNNATAVLILPVAISAAQGLGVNPKSFIIAVCFGASACFATPIGYQTNLLVYGPGGYRFSDYFKMGIPLNLIVLVLGTILIPLFWPL